MLRPSRPAIESIGSRSESSARSARRAVPRCAGFVLSSTAAALLARLVAHSACLFAQMVLASLNKIKRKYDSPEVRRCASLRANCTSSHALLWTESAFCPFGCPINRFPLGAVRRSVERGEGESTHSLSNSVRLPAATLRTHAYRALSEHSQWPPLRLRPHR